MTVTNAGLSIVLDRSSPMPLYFQVARQIEEAIEQGTLPPGRRLASEIELADRLGLSRPTMRRAIQELVDKGLLVRKRGVGTQVVHGRVRRAVELSSLHDDLGGSGRRPTTQVLVHEVVVADDLTAAHLGLPADAEVLHVERLRFAEGEPLAVLRNWLPVDLAPFSREDLEQRGLYDLLRHTGVHLRIATQRIGACAATSAEARLLGERRGAPLLTMQRVAYDDSGRAVELGTHVYRAGRYSFETTLVGR